MNNFKYSAVSFSKGAIFCAQKPHDTLPFITGSICTVYYFHDIKNSLTK